MSVVVNVGLGDRAYDVVVGPGAIATLADLAPSGPAFVIADTAVDAVTERVVAALASDGRRVVRHAVRGDEALKSWAAAGALYDALAAAEIGRDGILVAVGGGAVSDAAGFVAATYMRGIRWIAVPTTLLAQVDAAIGGKTALNAPAGKNLVGATHQPALVVADVTTLATLDPRDRLSGVGEIVKTALVGDPALFGVLEGRWRELVAGDVEATVAAVARCVAVKAAYVAADEHDTNGRRAALNFGHTVGHAYERVCGYGVLRHGEAVVLGMRVATALSALRGHLDPGVATRIDGVLASLPVPRPRVAADDLLAATRNDKKRAGGRVRYVLLRDVGVAINDDGVADGEVLAALASVA